jgi:general secretion pathway protein L
MERYEMGRLDPLSPGSPGRHAAVPAGWRGPMPDPVIRLPAELALRNILSLPLAAERDLRNVLHFELARQIPLKVDEVYFAYRVERRSPERQQLQVEVTVVPRSIVEDALAKAGALGFTPEGVEIAPAQQGGEPSGNLLHSEEAPRGRFQNRRWLLFLLCGVALLGIVAVYIPLEQAQHGAALLEEQVAAAKAQAERRGQAQREIERLQRDRIFLVDRKNRSLPVIELLNEMTRLLPDDTWLTELHIAGSEVHIHGYAASAASLIGLIEGATHFRKPMFRSPVLQDAKMGSERFQISAQISRERQE